MEVTILTKDIVNGKLNAYLVSRSDKFLPVIEGYSAIGDAAFEDCPRIQRISLSESVSAIGSSSFKGCTNLSAITLPETVDSIGGSAFEGCTNLSAITLPEALVSIGNGIFKDCTSLEDVSLPSTVTSIPRRAFENTAIRRFVNSDVTELHDSVFYSCEELSYVDMPNLTAAGEWAFAGCDKLSAVNLPNLKSISYRVFNHCSSLTVISLPRVSAAEDSLYSFVQNCSSLQRISLPALSGSFSKYCAFPGCVNLSCLEIDNVSSIFSDIDLNYEMPVLAMTTLSAKMLDFDKCYKGVLFVFPNLTSINTDNTTSRVAGMDGSHGKAECIITQGYDDDDGHRTTDFSRYQIKYILKDDRDFTVPKDWHNDRLRDIYNGNMSDAEIRTHIPSGIRSIDLPNFSGTDFLIGTHEQSTFNLSGFNDLISVNLPIFEGIVYLTNCPNVTSAYVYTLDDGLYVGPSSLMDTPKLTDLGIVDGLDAYIDWIDTPYRAFDNCGWSNAQLQTKGFSSHGDCICEVGSDQTEFTASAEMQLIPGSLHKACSLSAIRLESRAYVDYDVYGSYVGDTTSPARYALKKLSVCAADDCAVSLTPSAFICCSSLTELDLDGEITCPSAFIDCQALQTIEYLRNSATKSKFISADPIVQQIKTVRLGPNVDNCQDGFLTNLSVLEFVDLQQNSNFDPDDESVNRLNWGVAEQAQFIYSGYRRIEFDAMGGDVSASVQYYPTAESVPLQTASKSGYNFVGWHSNPQLTGDIYSSSASIPESVSKLYAEYDMLKLAITKDDCHS